VPEGVSGDASVAGQGNALGRERVTELQRARILAAMTELVRERGPARIAVAHIVARSGVSRRTFYELFEDREDCLAAAFDHAVACAASVVLPAYHGAGSVWQERIRAGLAALLAFLDEEPAMGSLCIVDALAAERGLLQRRARVVNVMVDAVHRGAGGGPGTRGNATAGAGSAAAPSRAAGVTGLGAAARARSGAAGSRRPQRIVAEGVVGAVLAVIHGRLVQQTPTTAGTERASKQSTTAARRPKPLSGLLNELMAMVVLPYLGPAAAAREHRRPAARRPRRAPRSAADPLRELDVRLTYRTVRVLLAISELGARGCRPSGRQVGDAAGIPDQGQMSKLLRRLEHIGLIANATPVRGKGEPNAWSLTPKGHEIERAIRAQIA
jgi:AcrR family transcriptional regulator